MEDQTLVRQLQAGDCAAFDQIYQKYSTELFRTAILICRNRTDAEDALQETFVALFQKAGMIEKPESLKFWLLKCLSGKAKDILRRKRREYPEEFITELSEQTGFARGNATDPASELIEQTAFADYLSALPRKFREVLVLYYYNGLSVKEIAALTGQREGTVKSRLYHARAQLKKRMDGGIACQEKRATIVSIER